jgi:hypothetical protein
LTPELIKRSEQVLARHRLAPIGSEFELRVDGRRYVARIELHEGAAKGKHKGVTLYAAK